MDYNTKQKAVRSFGDVWVKDTRRKIQIVGVILRENGAKTLFVGRYTDSGSKDEYLFYKEELDFPVQKEHLVREKTSANR